MLARLPVTDVPVHIRKKGGLRIALFSPTISGRGGVESVLTNLISALQTKGDECRVYIFGGSPHKAWLSHIPWCVEIGHPAQSRPRRLLTYFPQIIQYMRKWRPDVIVCTDTTTVRIARWTSRVCGLSNVPILCWLHCSYRYLRMQAEVQEADANLCICQERVDEVRSFVSQTGRYPAGTEPVFLVYSGTSIGSRPALRRAQIPTFLFVGRIQYEATKRIKDLVEAAANLRGDFAIKLLGDGFAEEKRKILDLATELGVSERIAWLGWHADPWSAISEATAMVLLSDAEGFAMVTIEALAMGLPVISSDCGGVSKEAVIPGQSGWIFPVGDVPALTRILQTIIDNPASLPDSETVRKVAGRFSTGQMAEDFRSAINAVLKQKAIAAGRGDSNPTTSCIGPDPRHSGFRATSVRPARRPARD
jgi:UDP-D-galactose:(glucosyl)LPS alpha-1,6-D-galactosyltransferase